MTAEQLITVTAMLSVGEINTIHSIPGHPGVGGPCQRVGIIISGDKFEVDVAVNGNVQAWSDGARPGGMVHRVDNMIMKARAKRVAA